MQDKSFWKEIAPLLAIVAVLTVVIICFAPSLLFLGLICLSLTVWFSFRIQKRRAFREYKYIQKLSKSIEQANFYALRELPTAVTVFDSNGYLRWCNNKATEWFDCEEQDSFKDIFKSLDLGMFKEDNGESIYNFEDKIFKIIYHEYYFNKNNKDEKEKFFLLHFSDISQMEELKRKCIGNSIVIAYIQFDNYNNVLKGLSDTQRANIRAEANKLVSSWVDEINGVYKQSSDDFYIAVMHRSSLEDASEKNFDILDRFRSIKVGNKLPITFSMGISADGENVVDIGEKAQSCLDMALGRGGDQVAVSMDGAIKFYGGVTAAQEKNTRVAARSAAHVIRELMTNSDLVLVSGHINEDFDSIGAAVGVAKMAKIINKPVYIIVSGKGISLEKFEDLFEDDEDYKNIIITQDEAKSYITSSTLLCLVDHHRSMLSAASDLLDKIENKIIIDHHRRAEDIISDITFIYQEPAASSSCELITELLTYFDDNVEYSRMEASILYAGIAVDSKNFAVQTGARTFEAAATLRLAGADPVMVRQLFSEDIELVKSRAKILSNVEIINDKIAIAMTNLINDGKSSVAVAQAADIMLNMEGIKASFVLGQLANDVVISARSRGNINVQVIMEELGGGGHQTVAGVRIQAEDIGKLKEKILNLAKKQIEEGDEDESNS